MKYIHFTHVDAETGISVASEPALNGAIFPAVAGLQFEWARESRYPTAVPDLFGTCPDGSDHFIDGVIGELSQADYGQMKADEMEARKIKSVSMRQARLQLSVLGVLANVNAAISTMSEQAQIEWEYAATVEKNNPLIPQLAALLGWSDDETDNYFIEAAKL